MMNCIYLQIGQGFSCWLESLVQGIPVHSKYNGQSHKHQWQDQHDAGMNYKINIQSFFF